MIKLQCTIQLLSFLAANTVIVSVAQVCIRSHRLVKEPLLLSHHFVDFDLVVHVADHRDYRELLSAF